MSVPSPPLKPIVRVPPTVHVAISPVTSSVQPLNDGRVIGAVAVTVVVVASVSVRVTSLAGSVTLIRSGVPPASTDTLIAAPALAGATRAMTLDASSAQREVLASIAVLPDPYGIADQCDHPVRSGFMSTG